MDVTARMYRTPTFRSARNVFLAKGTTANPSSTGTIMTIGTRAKAILSASRGTRSSLVMSLTRSTMGCSRPKGPHRLGPTRLWTLPINRRSPPDEDGGPQEHPVDQDEHDDEAGDEVVQGA